MPAVLPGAAVLLVGHGSQLSPDSSEPLHRLRRRLREAGTFPEVRVAFWKEEPALAHAFDLVERREVYVVPVFMSEGYFTRHVVPRELGLAVSTTCRGGRSVHYCRPVGTDPRMAGIVRDRALGAASVSPGRIDLVVVGHGTNLSPSSGNTTRSVAEALASHREFRRVRVAFLDQKPSLEGLLQAEPPVDERDEVELVIVPFFVSRGWHVGTTLLQTLSFPGGRRDEGGRLIRVTEPVGTHRAVADVVGELVVRKAAEVAGMARERSLPERIAGSASAPSRGRPREDSAVAPAGAREAFLAWIRAGTGSPRRFLQTVVSWSGEDGYELRHARDLDLPSAGLETIEDPSRVLGLARLAADGGYRPLRSAPDLVRGWRIAGLTADELWEVYGDLYPAAPVHWHRYREGRLRVTCFREFASSQTGMYAAVGRRSDAEIGALVGSVCSPEGCMREPVWWRAMAEPAAASSGASAGGAPRESPPSARHARVPCPRPCAVFLSTAAAALKEG